MQNNCNSLLHQQVQFNNTSNRAEERSKITGTIEASTSTVTGLSSTIGKSLNSNNIYGTILQSVTHSPRPLSLFTSIGDDSLFIVFSYIDLKHYTNFLLVCKSWYWLGVNSVAAQAHWKNVVDVLVHPIILEKFGSQVSQFKSLDSYYKQFCYLVNLLPRPITIQSLPNCTSIPACLKTNTYALNTDNKISTYHGARGVLLMILLSNMQQLPSHFSSAVSVQTYAGITMVNRMATLAEIALPFFLSDVFSVNNQGKSLYGYVPIAAKYISSKKHTENEMLQTNDGNDLNYDVVVQRSANDEEKLCRVRLKELNREGQASICRDANEYFATFFQNEKHLQFGIRFNLAEFSAECKSYTWRKQLFSMAYYATRGIILVHKEYTDYDTSDSDSSDDW